MPNNKYIHLSQTQKTPNLFFLYFEVYWGICAILPLKKIIICSAFKYKLSKYSQIFQWNIFIAGKLGGLTP